MDVVFLISTHNRQRSCQALVDSLQGLGDIVVLNDGCDYIISGAEQYFLTQHNGKARYWDTVRTLFSLRGKHKYYFILPDDFLIRDSQIAKAIALWENIKDPLKICLNLYSDRIGLPCWTTFKPIDLGEYYQTGWMDMCILCEDKFFDLVKIRKANPVYCRGEIRSSGVGSQISRFFHKRGYHFYQVKESLVDIQPEHYSSQMHHAGQRIPPKRYCKPPLRRRFTKDTRR